MMKKKRIKTLSVLILLITLLCACGNSNLENNKRVNYNDKTANTEYWGWKYFLSDNNYLVSSYFGNWSSKYNLRTGTITKLCSCMDAHSADCPFYMKRAQYEHFENGILYVRTFTIKDLGDGSSFERTSRLVAFNVATKEYDVLLEITHNEYEDMYGFCFSDGGAYYKRFIPNTALPESEADYKLSFCRLDLNTKAESVLFTVDKVPKLAELSAPCFITKDYVIFENNSLGELWRVNKDGSEFKWIINPSRDFPAILDAFGIFLNDSKIYFTVSAQIFDESAENELLLYRVDINNPVIERLSDIYVKWLFVTDERLYFEYSDIQKESDQVNKKHMIASMSHDGNNVTYLYPYNFDADYYEASHVWFDADNLYILAGWQRLIKSDDEGEKFDAGLTIIEYRVSDGNCKLLLDDD